MRTLQLYDHYLPTSENWSYNLIQHLPNTEIFIGAKYYLTNNFFDTSFTFFPQHPRGVLEQKNIQLNKFKPKELIQKIGIKVLQHLAGSLITDLVRFGKENKIDLVHAHFANVGWTFREVPRRIGCPFVISFYGWD